MAAGLFRCFATVPPGLEALTAGELTALGIPPAATEPGGVSFPATARQLYTANLQLRTANRIIVRLAEFPARAFYELERKAKRVPWGDVLALGAAVRFRVTSRKSKLYHLDGIAERLANSIEGHQPTGEIAGAQLFIVRVFRDLVTINADSSGDLLHRRGYRLATAKAPLRETLAAAILLGAGYDGGVPLLDPFCGSGTIPIEAALLTRCIPPGLNRKFAFEHWPSFDSNDWHEIRAKAESRVLPRAPAAILGSDRDAGAITAARANAERAGVSNDVEFRETALSTVSFPPGPGLLATNPPYGVRLEASSDLRDLYARLGALMHAHPGLALAMLSADETLERQLGLPLLTRWHSKNGGIPVRLVIGG